MLNDFEDADSLPEHLATLHRRLLHDGDRWQASLPTTDRLARLSRQLGSAPTTSPSGGNMSANRASSQLSSASHSVARGGLRRVVPTAAALLLVILGAAIFAVFAHHPKNTGATTPAAQGTAVPVQPSAIARKPANVTIPLPPNGFISSISMATANDGWAAGNNGFSGPDGPGENFSKIAAYFYHFHNGTWTVAPENFAGVEVGSVAMTSPEDGWAVGGTPTTTSKPGAPKVWHFTGGHWHLTSIPGLPGDGSVQPIAIYAPSPDFVWVKADRNTATRAEIAILTYHDGTWATIPTTFEAFHDDVSMVSASEGWAVQQSTGGTDTLHFLHYQGGTWNEVAHFPGSGPHLSMLSTQEGWAVGQSGTTASGQEVFHFSGQAWQLVSPTVPLPSSDNFAITLTATAPDEMWVGGADSLVFADHGQWLTQTLPQQNLGIAQIIADGDGGVWVLAFANNDAGHPFILYDLNGTWTVYGQGVRS